MASRYFRQAAVITALLVVTRAQQSDVVPEDLRAGFKSTGKEVQVSYTNEAVNGFEDGTSFEKDAVAKEPTFALGDSSGISPTTLYTILMIDTTCPNARKLHYARANFKNNFQITNIDTQSAALLDYKAPGALGETGDNRQYTFLMYTNPGRKQIDQLQLPAEGENFDVQKFQSDNGLSDAAAGVGMVVKLGGTANCGGDQPNKVPDNSPSAQPAPSSAARASSAAPAPSSKESRGGNDSRPSVTSLRRTTATDLAGASSVLQTGAPGASTIAPAISPSNRPGGAGPTGGAGASGSPTASTSLAQQTANAAPGMLTSHGLAVAPLLAIAGVLLW
ncbi:uncharacterized protein K460DRAFT_270649 [Cucurbitaria berberidis CBS 394.84]|uniref:Uncharacterized protein n=1 Tax=Cucurbitaria berberidis CBS 394.84 TaxID=1168544 RepID=A0A9P4GUP6_9PLEO|nr:uncharacterized protein K460DRAFT_270649 [Cucurbitaria berberidis CBS 394.84]KAF1851695.1 hypothetical protein K460DRAFT_270649 [Cucurbitaria berberidis CBS 394.84]